ncbi:hypothetical protein J31TS4_28420 [Paenibacillus sp. J31TS4]|uniref:DNA internalization-related competence protein ComEC/Rec2 n=1 Tax=Paenibacillus sp. J31TS4 TaxID=2807195 RepID=UPI001B06F55C|nr:DNA internalization-related competence protein ComEC/Rec2 [Paenibacillus sp. J31TS4]GIP39562.1 hypothetical protein J31TS4_28420 [Paenibacillus sp. J31TS4]
MKRPLVFGTVCWIAGGTLALQTTQTRMGLTLLLSGVGALLLLIAARLPYRMWTHLPLVLLIAFGYTQWIDEGNQSAWGDDHNGMEMTASGRLLSPVDVDGDTVSAILLLSAADFGEGEEAVEERVRLTLKLLLQEEQELARTWQRGDELRLTGTLKTPSVARNEGGFDYRDYLRLQRIHWQLSVKGMEQAARERVFRLDWTELNRHNDALRERLGSLLDRLYPAEQAGYMKGLLIGLRSDLDPEQFQQFSQLGLTHILAISGLHVAVFVAVVMGLLSACRVPRETSQLAAMLLLPGYILLTGCSPSVVRAGFMGMIALYAARKRMLKDGLNLISLVCLAMLLWDPYYLRNVSFQLSFLVTAGLVLGVPLMSKLLPARYPALMGAVAVTTVAQLVSFPVSIYYFNQFSLVSWTANLILVPFISMVVTPAGSVSLVVGLLWESAGRLIAVPVDWMNRLSFWAVEIMDSWDWFHTIWPSPPLWWLLAYYAALGTGMTALVRLRAASNQAELRPMLELKQPVFLGRWRRATLGSGLLLAVLLVYGYSPDRWSGLGRVDFLDVGQGDSILIQSPDGRRMLIDGGGTVTFRKPGQEWKERRHPYEVGEKVVVPLLKKRGVHELEWLVLTHADNDHIGGLQAVLEQIPVKRILYNGTLKENAGYRKLLETALAKDIPLYAAEAGQTIRLGEGTFLRCLFPEWSDEPAAFEGKQNDRSIVLLLDLLGTRILLPGDLEKAGEAAVVDQLFTQLVTVPASAESGAPAAGAAGTSEVAQAGPQQGAAEGKQSNGRGSGGGEAAVLASSSPPPRGVDVLKVGHHGSKTSTTEEWLTAWQPRVAVISVGENNVYGHPAKPVLDRLAAFGAEVYRTDQQGEVRFLVRRDGFRIRTQLHHETGNRLSASE